MKAFSCLLFLFIYNYCSAQEESQRVNSDIRLTIYAEDKSTLSQKPTRLEIDTSVWQLKTLKLHFTHDALKINYDFTDHKGRNSLASHSISMMPETKKIDFILNTIPIHHDFNSDSFTDFALHLSTIGDGDQALFFIYNPKLREYQLHNLRLGYKQSLAFDLTKNLLSFHTYDLNGGNGVISWATYFTLVGYKWVKVGEISFSHYFANFSVLRNGQSKNLYVDRELWLIRNNVQHNKRLPKFIEENILIFWEPTEGQLEELCRLIANPNSQHLPTLLKHLSKENLIRLLSKLKSQEVTPKLQNNLTKLISNQASYTLPNYRFHRVEQGETLFSISKAKGISIQKLMELNKLNSNSVIFAGETLLINK